MKGLAGHSGPVFDRRVGFVLTVAGGSRGLRV